MEHGDWCGVFRQEVASDLSPTPGFAKGSLFCPRDFLSEDDSDKKQNTQSSDDSFEPYPEKK